MPLYDGQHTLLKLIQLNSLSMKNNTRLFIVSNRLPVTIVDDGDGIKVNTSAGGLVTAMNSFLQGQQQEFAETFWVGVPGCNPPVWEKAVCLTQQAPYTYLPVFIFKDQYDKYYNGLSNSLLWPLFHYFP